MSIGVASFPRTGPATRLRSTFFPVACTLLLVLSVVAFADNLVTDVGQASNRDPGKAVHGLFLLAWMILLSLQANLAAWRKLRWHRQLGPAAFLVAAGVVASTLYLFVAVWSGWEAMAPNVKANRLLLPGFALLVLLGYLHRRRPEAHKRLVFGATLLMPEPVLSRLFDPIVLPFLPAMPEPRVEATFLVWLFASWIGAFAALFGYDLLLRRRVHWASLAAFGWFCAGWVVALAF